MTTNAHTAPASLYFGNLSRAFDNFIGALLLLKPSEIAECFNNACAMARLAGEEGTSVRPSQLQKIRALAGLAPLDSDE